MSKKKRPKKPSTRVNKKELVRNIINVFNENAEKTFNYKQMSTLLDVKSESQRIFINQLMYELLEEEFLVEISRGKFKLNSRGGYIEGKIDRQGVKTYLIPDDGGEPVFIPERKTNHAFLNDRVKVFLYARRKGQMPEGEVVEITKRAKDTFVGILEVLDNFAFLISDNKVLTNDIFIPKNKLNGGKNGQKAVVRLTEWTPNMKNPVGEVIDVLGEKGNNTVEMHAILAEFGLPYKYPEKVEEAANQIDAGITPEEISKRIDMRKITTFTIDPRDAKDFDDALSIRKLDNGLWEIGVHIADVTHYVRPHSIIEEEARERATSVYLVDRTIPMLPEHLSNGICSLRPNEEKLTYSVIFQMNDKAEIQHYQIAKTVICSDRRFTYEEAQAIIENKQGDYSEELLTMDALAKTLRQNH
jgi:ribonuclease R